MTDLADRRDVPTVYQPAEDSGLLLEAARSGLTAEDLVLEVGVGSGWVAERVREEVGARVVGCDVNQAACRAARNRGVPTVQADLVGPFRSGTFDVVLCNPPYLPTPAEEEWDDPLEAALSGGEDGRRVIRPLIRDVDRVLAPDGRVYLVVSSLTGIDAVGALAEEAGFDHREVAAASFPFERLVVLELL